MSFQWLLPSPKTLVLLYKNKDLDLLTCLPPTGTLAFLLSWNLPSSLQGCVPEPPPLLNVISPSNNQLDLEVLSSILPYPTPSLYQSL